jgi:hypothetical protein
VKTRIHKGSDFSKYVFRARAPAGATYLRNDAVRTATITTILQLDERAGFSPGVRHRREQAVCIFTKRGVKNLAVRPVFKVIQNFWQSVPLGIADYEAHSWNCGQRFRIPLSIAPGYDDTRGGVFAVKTPERLAYLLVRSMGYRTGIDYNYVGVPMAFRLQH